MLTVEHLTKQFGEKTLFRDLCLTVDGPAVLWAPSGYAALPADAKGHTAPLPEGRQHRRQPHSPQAAGKRQAEHFCHFQQLWICAPDAGAHRAVQHRQHHQKADEHRK